MADTTASFFKIQSQFSKASNSQETTLVVDETLPKFSAATVARFAPSKGAQAAIVDELGIHLVDMKSKKESLTIVQPDIQ